MKPKRPAHIFLYLIIIIAIVILAITVTKGWGGEEIPGLGWSEVCNIAEEGKIDHVDLTGTEMAITTKEDYTPLHPPEHYEDYGTKNKFSCLMPPNTDITDINAFPEFDGLINTVSEPSGFNWGSILITLLPILLLLGLFWFLLRGARSAGNQAMNFGRNRAQMLVGTKPSVTFNDVAGIDEAKQELYEVVEFLKFPEKFLKLGARIPRGVLLVGSPGTGKTLLARAVAGEAGVAFFSISGSEFVEMFVGVGASRVRDLFNQAKRNSPCIVFVDEIDAVGRHRGTGVGGGHDEREQTLNQLLVEMDGFDTNTGIIVLSATNRPDILDPALLRPGRFDRQVILDRPDINGRKAILEVHARGKPFDSSVNMEIVARLTPGFTGADLANLLNEAAILAARQDKDKISLQNIEEAVDRVIAGPERKSRRISENEKRMTAYHEAGHALTARMLPHADPVHKISIISRGVMGGYTRLLPIEDRYLWTRSQFKDMLAVSLAGQVAEQLIFNEMTTGPSSDIEQATKLARKMVTEYGMSDKLGSRTFGRREDMVFLGKDFADHKDYSEKIAEEIDDEVQSFISEAYQRAQEILTQNRAKLEQIAERLLVEETIEGEELNRLFDEPAPSYEGKPPTVQTNESS